VFPYHLVGAMASFPLASSTHATIVVRADVLDDIAVTRWARDQELIGQTEQLAAESLGEELGFQSPLEGYGNTVVSRQPPEVLEQLAEAAGWRVPEVRGIADRTGDVASRSTRWAFDHLGILGVVGAVVALASLALYLAERRRDREVATVMSEQMGISRSVNVVAAVVELLGLVTVAVLAGVASALVTARHVFPSFEPDPTAPPAVGLTIDPAGIGAFLAITAVAVAALAAVAQRRASSARRAEVLRG
jgi:hypothetical protein